MINSRVFFSPKKLSSFLWNARCIYETSKDCCYETQKNKTTYIRIFFADAEKQGGAAMFVQPQYPAS